MGSPAIRRGHRRTGEANKTFERSHRSPVHKLAALGANAAVASRQDGENCRRREHIHLDAARFRSAGIIGFRCPAQERLAAHRKGPLLLRGDERAIGQRVDIPAMEALHASTPPLRWSISSISSARGGRACSPFASCHCAANVHRILAAAFEAGPMASRERRRFIKKEQLGIEAAPDVAMPSLEVENAADPLPRRPAAVRQCLYIGVKTTAAVAHEQPTCRYSGQVAERRDAILQRRSAVARGRHHRLMGANGAGDISLLSCLIR